MRDAESLPSLDVQHLWYEVRRQRPSWKTLALAAVDEGEAPIRLARELGHLAARETGQRALVVSTATRPDAPRGSAPLPKDPWVVLLNDRAKPIAGGSEHVSYLAFDHVDGDWAERALADAPQAMRHLADGSLGYASAIFALESVLTRPAGIQLARAVDTVVLCVRLGESSLDDTRRITEVIGRDKILGTLAIRSSDTRAGPTR